MGKYQVVVSRVCINLLRLNRFGKNLAAFYLGYARKISFLRGDRSGPGLSCFATRKETSQKVGVTIIKMTKKSTAWACAVMLIAAALLPVAQNAWSQNVPLKVLDWWKSQGRTSAGSWQKPCRTTGQSGYLQLRMVCPFTA